MRTGLLLPALILLLVVAAVHAQEIEPAWLEVADVALRRVGEQRLFRVQDVVSGQWFTVNAELRAISDHALIYTHARSADDLLPDDGSLQGLGEQFDERVYLPSLDLWGIEDSPAIEGDERVVILIAAGYSDNFATPGDFYPIQNLPGESDPEGSGFLSIRLSGKGADVSSVGNDTFLPAILAGNFQRMLHRHTDGNPATWVASSLARFTAYSLGLSPGRSRFSVPRMQLNDPSNYSYAGVLFLSYISGRLGPDALRDFAAHPDFGLDALDALLAERSAGMDADDFFADWVLANYLQDTQREEGRYGYRSLDRVSLAPPPPLHSIRRLPAGFREELPPYATDYYELEPPPGDAEVEALLLDFRLVDPAPQDAWLQVVQVLPERIDVQRFRAGEHRGRALRAPLQDRAERIVVAVSPFTPGARERRQPVSYSLALREHLSAAADQAQVTTTLNLHSNPEIADNIIANLQPCSLVLVLERRAEWSRIQSGDGFVGWAQNDHLFHPGAPGAVPNACAALTRAAYDGDLLEVRRLLLTGAPVDGTDAGGRTALHEAAFQGHEDIVAYLLDAGADVHVQDAAGHTPLSEAMRAGNAGALQLPLIEAAGQGHDALLELILAEGHDVDWQNEKGRTALAAAAANGRARALELLLAAGADPHILDHDGRSPLMLAGASGEPEALALLHAAGGAVNRQDGEGHTALTLAAANGQAMNVAWLLLDSQADVHHTLPESGRNALHLASAAGHDDVVALLLLGNADISAQDAEGFTAMQLAMAAGHERSARYLRMADPAQTRPRAGLTETQLSDLFAAARHGDLAEVDALLAAATIPGWRGNPLLATDEEGLTALMLAAGAGHRPVVLRLLLAGAKPDIRANTEWDEPALYFTIHAGYDDLSAMLLLAGATPVAYPGARPSTTALMWAAEYGREDIAHLLLNLHGSQRIDVNERDPSRRTALFLAAFNGHANVARILLAAGANPDIPDFQGTTPLLAAVSRGNVAMVDRLLAAGVSPDGRSDDIPSPLAMDKQEGNFRIIQLLLAAGAEG